MKRIIPLALAIASGFAMISVSHLLTTRAGAQESGQHAPQFTKDNRLVRPMDYREWIYLTSGLGMTYGPAANRVDVAPLFDNVFVHPTAYRSFLKTGEWPDKTIFVLEVRSAKSHGSINKDGQFQTGVVAVEAAVKDEARFPEKWSYFSFDSPSNAKSAAAFPKAECFDCHKKSGAVENTFVQFYPTMLEVATRMGTLNPGYISSLTKE